MRAVVKHKIEGMTEAIGGFFRRSVALP